MATVSTNKRAAVKSPRTKTAAPAKTRAPARKAQASAMKAAVKAPAKVAKPMKKIVAPEVQPEAEVREKPKKIKLVRDSFTMPEAEYAVLGEVKKACLKAGFEVKKSELLRIGVALIRGMEAAKLKAVLDTLPALKAGRPKKGK